MSILESITRKVYRPAEGRIVFSTEARGLQSLSRAVARQTPAEIRAGEETMRVALAQPHRRGNPDKRAGEPLYDIWLAMRLRDELYDAGARYGELVRQDRAAIGLHVPGLSRDEGESVLLTEDEIQANREAAKARREEANYELRGVMPRAVGVMEKLCYDRLPPSIYDHDLIKNCLWRLAVHFNPRILGINAGKGP